VFFPLYKCRKSSVGRTWTLTPIRLIDVNGAQDPVYVSKQQEARNNPELKKKQADAVTAHYQDPENRKKQSDACKFYRDDSKPNLKKKMGRESRGR
jgi:hypothetical protein